MDNPKLPSGFTPPNSFLIEYKDRILEEGVNIWDAAIRLWESLSWREKMAYLLIDQERNTVIRQLISETQPYNGANAQSIIDNELENSTISAITDKKKGSMIKLPKKAKILNPTPTPGFGKRRKIQPANSDIESPPPDFHNSIIQIWNDRE